jgi:hypothetical protein
VDLLRRWRATERQDEELLRALLATVHGIANGLQKYGLTCRARQGDDQTTRPRH